MSQNTDNSYPEGFDASCGHSARAMRAANAIMANVIARREWDVPMVAAALESFASAPAPAPELSDTLALLRDPKFTMAGGSEFALQIVALLSASRPAPKGGALPEIIRILAEWEDANGSLSAVLPEEWAALMEPIAYAAITESPRMVRHRFLPLPQGSGDSRKCLYCNRDMLAGSECTSASQSSNCAMLAASTEGSADTDGVSVLHHESPEPSPTDASIRALDSRGTAPQQEGE